MQGQLEVVLPGARCPGIDKSEKHGSVWLVSLVYQLPVYVVVGGSVCGGDGSSGEVVTEVLGVFVVIVIM